MFEAVLLMLASEAASTHALPTVVTPPVVHAVVPHAPTPRNAPGNWVLVDDYPISAIRNGEQGITGFRLKVDAQGQVVACEITASSGSATLDKATCDLVARRAQFSPALDASGQPVAGGYSNRVRWVLPARADLPRARRMVVSYIVEIDGSRSHCQLVEAEGDIPEAVKKAAAQCPAAPFAEAYRDGAGHLVRRKVTVSQIVEVQDVPEGE